MKVVSFVLLTAAAVACSSIKEQAVLENYSHLIFRPDSTTLCIITTEGDTVVYRDSRDVESALDYASYRAVDYNGEMNYWVVELAGYEWIEWHVVDGSTGTVDTTISIPVPGPEGIRLLCFKKDITATFIPNGIQVWRREQDGLTLEFEDVDVPWEPTEAECRY